MANLFQHARAKEKKNPLPKKNYNKNREFNLDYEQPLVIGSENHSVEEYIVFYSKKNSK